MPNTKNTSQLVKTGSDKAVKKERTNAKAISQGIIDWGKEASKSLPKTAINYEEGNIVLVSPRNRGNCSEGKKKTTGAQAVKKLLGLELNNLPEGCKTEGRTLAHRPLINFYLGGGDAVILNLTGSQLEKLWDKVDKTDVVYAMTESTYHDMYNAVANADNVKYVENTKAGAIAKKRSDELEGKITDEALADYTARKVYREKINAYSKNFRKFVEESKVLLKKAA